MCKHSLWAWLALASVFCGCWSGGYKIEVDNRASMGATLNYHIVDKLDPDQYNEEAMPIVVDMVRTGRGFGYERGDDFVVVLHFGDSACVV